MSNWKDFITHLFTTGHNSLPKIKQDMITHLEILFSGKPKLCGDLPLPLHMGRGREVTSGSLATARDTQHTGAELNTKSQATDQVSRFSLLNTNYLKTS